MRSPPSAREIGVRKVAGASRIQVIGQHLAESIGITGIAFLLAVALAVLCLPILNGVTDKSIEVAFLMQMPVLLALAGFALLIGLVGGSPPALVLTAFSAAETLKNPWDGKRGRRFRSVLVVGGHDVVTVGALGLGTSEDVKLIRTAEENGRIF